MADNLTLDLPAPARGPGLEATGGGKCLFARSKLAQFTAGLKTSAFAEKAGTAIKAGYLASPKTPERKLFSDVLFGGVEYLATRPLAVATDYLQSVARSAATFGRIKPHEFRQLANNVNWPGFLSGIKGFRDGAVKGVQLMRTGVDPEKMDQAQGLFDLAQTNYKNKVLERSTRAVFDLLEAQTKPFYGFAYNTSLYGRAKLLGIREGLSGSALVDRTNELLGNPTEQMVLGAHADAQYAVFKNQTTLSGLASSIRSGARRKLATAKPGSRFGWSAANLALDVTVPFTKLPSAILMAGIDYSPAGFVKALVHAADPDPLIQGQIQKQLARATIGTGLTMLGYSLSAAGNMTGSGPTEASQRKIWDAENKQANSIKINGRWRTITSLGPLALPMLLGANIQRYSAEGEEKSGADLAAAGSASLAKTITEESYLQGVSNLIGAISEPGARGASAIAGMVPVPAIVGQVASAIDPTAREAHGVLEKLEAKTPFLSRRLPARLDPFGQEIQKNAGGIRGAAESLLDPTNPKTDASTPLTTELERLQVGLSAPGSSYTVKGVKHQRSQERIRDLTKEIGPEYRTELEKLIQTPRYKAADDDEKGRLLRKTMSTVRTPVYRKEKRSDLSYAAFQALQRAQLEVPK